MQQQPPKIHKTNRIEEKNKQSTVVHRYSNIPFSVMKRLEKIVMIKKNVGELTHPNFKTNQIPNFVVLA